MPHRQQLRKKTLLSLDLQENARNLTAVVQANPNSKSTLPFPKVLCFEVLSRQAKFTLFTTGPEKVKCWFHDQFLLSLLARIAAWYFFLAVAMQAGRIKRFLVQIETVHSADVR